MKHVVITSSFAAIINPPKGLYPGHIYSEQDWNPITLEEAYLNSANGYRASKTFAEKAAWEFIEKEKPNFTYVIFMHRLSQYLASFDGNRGPVPSMR